MRKALIIVLVQAFISWNGVSSGSIQSQDWKAPPEADKINNPIYNNSVATNEGKKLFNQYCVICHGISGKGDGIAGMTLKPRPSNFTTDKVQSQTDGAIFWKMTNGRPPMASYKEILSENQRWQLVNYIRTLKK